MIYKDMTPEQKKKYNTELELRHRKEKLKPEHKAKPKKHISKYKYPIWAEIDRYRK